MSDGESGLVVAGGDVDALATAMDRLLADPLEAQRLGARARHDVLEEHTAARHYERLMSVYESARSEDL